MKLTRLTQIALALVCLLLLVVSALGGGKHKSALSGPIYTNAAIQPVWLPGTSRINISVPATVSGTTAPTVNVYQDFNGSSLLGTVAANSNSNFIAYGVVYVSSVTAGQCTVTPVSAQNSVPQAVTLSATTLTLSSSQYLSDVLDFGGSPGAGVTITFPTQTGYKWYVENNSGQTITLQVSGQSSPPTLATGNHAIYVIDDNSVLVQWTAAH